MARGSLRAGIQQLRNKCTPPTPLRTVGSCDPCAQGYEPTPRHLRHHHAGHAPAGRLNTSTEGAITP